MGPGGLSFLSFCGEKITENLIFTFFFHFSVCPRLELGCVQGRNQFSDVFRTLTLRGLDFSFAKTTANGYLYNELGQT